MKEITSSNNPQKQLIEGYSQWLKDYRDCAANSIELRAMYLSQFLGLLSVESLELALRTLSHEQVEKLFLNYSQGRGQSARRSMQATLRTFFKYCHFKGLTTQDLSGSIPTLRVYKLSSLPRSISESESEEVFDSIDLSCATGIRDLAILKLLYHYGVRAEQIRSLKLEDIDWRGSRIFFRALKHGKPIMFPLLDEVAELLLNYLQQVRAQSEYREVFLTFHKPIRPFRSSGSITQIARIHLKKVQIESGSFGAHAFRHAFAQRMLRQGNSIKFIADCLGHSTIQTTEIYAKVDFSALSAVPLELPILEVVA